MHVYNLTKNCINKPVSCTWAREVHDRKELAERSKDVTNEPPVNMFKKSLLDLRKITLIKEQEMYSLPFHEKK